MLNKKKWMLFFSFHFHLPNLKKKSEKKRATKKVRKKIYAIDNSSDNQIELIKKKFFLRILGYWFTRGVKKKINTIFELVFDINLLNIFNWIKDIYILYKIK